MIQRFALLVLGCSQTWEANSLSRCASKFRIISSKDLPVGGPDGLNTQAHSEQPQPRKRPSSIHMSSRLAAIYRRKIKYRVRMFRAIIFFSFTTQHHAVHFGGPSVNSRNLLFRNATEQIQHRESVVPPCTFR